MWLSFLCGSFSPQPDGVAHAVVSALPYILETEHIYIGNVSSANHDLCENSCKPQQKKLFKFTKKITHVDDMMIHNLVKYLVQTRLFLLFLYLTNKVDFGQSIL